MDKKVIPIILIIVITTLLIGFIVTGWQSRYLADDYCYDAEFIQHGFWQGQIDSYLNRMTYSSNRYSLTLFSGIAWALGGVRISPLLPALVILLWGTALFFAIYEGAKAAQIEMNFYVIIAITMVISFFTFLLAPNRYQILYWRSGMIPYLLPLLFTTFLTGLFLLYVQRDRISIVELITLTFVSWVAAGFSETVFALQTGFWVLILLYSLILKKRTARKAAFAILIGIIVGLFLLTLNPTNADRQSAFPTPPPLPEVIYLSLIYSGTFTYDFIRSTPLPFLVLIFSGILFGWMEFQSFTLRWKSILIFLCSSIIGTYLLLACIMAPTIWSMSSFPERRGLLSAAFLINLLLFAVGVLIGVIGSNLLNKLIPLRWKTIMSFVLTVALSAYLIHLIPSIYGEIPSYQKRAELWDARNTAILQSKSTGETHIIVPGIDSISGVIELQKDKDYWVNRCAAIYYGVDDIQTTE